MNQVAFCANAWEEGRHGAGGGGGSSSTPRHQVSSKTERGQKQKAAELTAGTSAVRKKGALVLARRKVEWRFLLKAVCLLDDTPNTRSSRQQQRQRALPVAPLGAAEVHETTSACLGCRQSILFQNHHIATTSRSSLYEICKIGNLSGSQICSCDMLFRAVLQTGRCAQTYPSAVQCRGSTFDGKGVQ